MESCSPSPRRRLETQNDIVTPAVLDRSTVVPERPGRYHAASCQTGMTGSDRLLSGVVCPARGGQRASLSDAIDADLTSNWAIRLRHLPSRYLAPTPTCPFASAGFAFRVNVAASNTNWTSGLAEARS